jgi:hypothetical protein
MSQQALQKAGGALTSPTLSALNTNFNDLYSYYGVAAGDPFATDLFVDGDNGSDTNDGFTPGTAKASIQAAIDAAGQGDRIFIKPKWGDTASGDTDPDSYSESLSIAGKDGLQLIGISRGLSQGGQPQLKVGSTTTSPIITVGSSGVGIYNLTINGASATGGGIYLYTNGSTQDAFGTTIGNCHFKNCKSTGAAATGGAIYWPAAGGSWQVTIDNCDFYKCRAGIVLIGTSSSRPQDVKILNCRFYSAANTDVDADIYEGGSGFASLVVDNCVFGTVDVPAYASSPSAARYIYLTGAAGVISRCFFACIGDPAGSEKTFGAAGTACYIPTTVRFVACWGEGVAGTADHSIVGRT